MIRRPLVVLLLLALTALSALPTLAHPEHKPPAGRPPGFEPSSARATSPLPPDAQGMTLVGALRLGPGDQLAFGDVGVYKNLAFIGKFGEACSGAGVDIIDIADPAAPAKLAETPREPGTAFEDMKAVRIGARDVLVIGLQACGPGGKAGLDVVDITDPRQPRRLSFFETGSDGVHELDVTTTPRGRTLALLAVPFLEPSTVDEAGAGGQGDLLIVDLTDPARPALAGEWGVLDAPGFGPAFFEGSARGSDPATFLHSARASADGTRAYLSYWDGGVIILDIADPARPVPLGRTTYGGADEGNAHSVATGRGGTLLVQADEDFSPFAATLRATAPAAVAGEYPVLSEAPFVPIASLPGEALTGTLVDVGRGCPAGVPGAPAGGDPYPAGVAGKIALIEAGQCAFRDKIVRAQQAGATGAILYLAAPDAPPPARTTVAEQIAIPAIVTTRAAGMAFAGAARGEAPVAVTITATFNGWGGLRFFDIADPARPVALGTFATPNTRNKAVALEGEWSAHNPEIVGTTLYASWYSDGVRMLDIANPAAPRETGFWRGAGAPADAPPVNIWGVVPHNGLLLLSDMSFGLYIVRPAVAPAPPGTGSGGTLPGLPNTGGGAGADRVGAAVALSTGVGLVALGVLATALRRRRTT